MARTWAWVSGWGIDPNRFRLAAEQSFPEWEHEVFAPTASAIESALSTNPSRIGGYSLGSLLLFEAMTKIPETTEVYCYAPILAFCAEFEMAGRTPAASLLAIEARLQESPGKALKLFYRLAGLNDPAPTKLPYTQDDLAWGLEALRTKQVVIPIRSELKCVLGERDPLIDSHKFRALFTQLRLAPCGHDYHDLLDHTP